jgi:hypothetical protein
MFVFLLFAVACRGAEGLPAPRFETDVRPILKAHCWHCHGEETDVQGKFDARLARSILQGGESGPSIVTGKHAESLLYQRIAAGEMPPGKKPLSAAQVEVIARWIDAGALTVRPEPEKVSEGTTFTDEERQHWSFQPIRRPLLPSVARGDLVRTPIDVFLLAKLESHGLSFGPEADRETLIRRLHFDLVGLPPAPEAIDEFVSDESPEAYDHLVDRLLASPAYGERWARHWLDVAGYADSDGYSEVDSVRPWAYRYRDYVIRTFNQDKPWNEFLVEQLAGDELLPPPYQDLTPEQVDRLTATGFLRMGPDGTADSSVDVNAARNAVIAETIKITTTSLLGLSVGCAQCHDHRYEPISQVDYYRLRALFEPVYDWQNWRPPSNRLVSLWPAEARDRAAAVDREVQEIESRRLGELDSLIEETFQRELAKLPPEMQPLAKLARATPEDQRTEEQKQLIRKHSFITVDRGTLYLFVSDQLAAFNKKWSDLTAAASQKRPADDSAMCATEIVGQIPMTRLFFRGDFQQPRQEVGPGELTILNTSNLTIPADDPQLPTSGRRLAYARHLTSGRHPLVGRVLVNRFWLHHFGHGLVNTPSDLGLRGESPSHPELLDWLAADFMEEGWKLKRLHRLIVQSTAYRQTSARREELDAADPENRWLGRMSIRRLEAETLRDAILAVSGQLTTKLYGPPVPVSPDVSGHGFVVAVNRFNSSGQVDKGPVSLGAEEFRRSIYLQARRTMPLSLLEPFDLPTMVPNCERRASSTTPSQSLVMLNSDFVIQQSDALATRVQREEGELPRQFQRAWRLVYGRTPSPSDTEKGLAFLRGELAARETDGKAPSDRSKTALRHFCQALLSSHGFLYVE